MSLVRRLSRSQLVRGSILVFLGNNIASFGNFLYNLFMGRLLGPEKYGDLGAILSLMILIGLPLGLLNLPLVKIIASYWGKRKIAHITSFLNYLTLPFFLLGLAVAVILVFSQSFFASFLHLSSSAPVLIIAASFIISGPATLNRAALQGILSFSFLALNSFIEVSLKVVISLLLVIFNFSLIGALLGPLAGGIVGYLLTIIELRYILGSSKEKDIQMSTGSLLATFWPIFLATLALTSLLTVDMVLVRHFFPAQIAGEYAALSTTGKIIYYIVGPIITVMFPVISSRVSSGLPYILPLVGTLAASLGLAAVVISSFFLFPKLIIGIFYGNRYYGVVPYLGIFSLFITIYTVCSILTHFLLSISFYRPIYPLFLISMLQAVLIFIFHDSISQIIWVNIIVSLIYLLTISSFVLKNEGEKLIGILVKVLPRGIYSE